MPSTNKKAHGREPVSLIVRMHGWRCRHQASRRTWSPYRPVL